MVLALAALIQTAVLPLNLCLILLIVRSLSLVDRSNFYLAFFGGIILGVLSSTNIGFWPLTFLTAVVLCQTIKKIPVLSNLFFISLTAVSLILFTSFLQFLVYRQNIDIKIVFFEILLLVPGFFLIRFWEDRFVVKTGIKLRLKQSL